MQKVIIDRETWCRGFMPGISTHVALRFNVNRNDPTDGAAKPPTYYHCCLGFLCMNAGIPPISLLDEAMPKDLADHGEALVPQFLTEEATEEMKAETMALGVPDFIHWPRPPLTEDIFALINDRKGISEAEREAFIAKWFLHFGWVTEFIN